MSQPFLEIDNLHVRFPIVGGGALGFERKTLHAVNGLSMTLEKGECLSVVGELGCGKSATALAMMGLQEPSEGVIRLRGAPFTGPEGPDRMARARAAQMVFQDPYASLNPRKSVAATLAGPLKLHGIGAKSEIDDRIEAILRNVGLPAEHARRFPHEFSGGQRQRICIARALALQPKLIVADESVSALDVSVQARVLDLLAELKAELGISYLFISHDMAVVENISDRIAVMHLGQIVEMGSRAQIFGNPRHPYTRRLIDAVPVPDPTFIRPATARMASEVPSPVWPAGEGPERILLRDTGLGHMVAAGAAQA